MPALSASAMEILRYFHERNATFDNISPPIENFDLTAAFPHCSDDINFLVDHGFLCREQTDVFISPHYRSNRDGGTRFLHKPIYRYYLSQKALYFFSPNSMTDEERAEFDSQRELYIDHVVRQRTAEALALEKRALESAFEKRLSRSRIWSFACGFLFAIFIIIGIFG